MRIGRFLIFGILLAHVVCIYGCTQDLKRIRGYKEKCFSMGGEAMRGDGNYSYCILDGRIHDMRAQESEE